MYIFIDESGIHKTIDHSTFVLVYVEVNNYQYLSSRIIEIEKELGISYFHWSETAWPVRQKFIDEVLKLDFKIKIALIRNPINPATEMERILPHLIIEKNIIKIFIDGKKPKWYERKIKKILRDKTITVKKLKTVDDESEAGVRLADMIAGLARGYFDGYNRGRFDDYYRKLKRKIIIVLE